MPCSMPGTTQTTCPLTNKKIGVMVPSTLNSHCGVVEGSSPPSHPFLHNLQCTPIIFLLVFSPGVWTFARQVLYCLSHSSSPFCSGYFGVRVFFFLHKQLGPQFSYFRFPTIVRMTGACHHAHWHGIWQTIFLTWASLGQSSKSQPPIRLEMTGFHHCTQLLVETGPYEVFARAGLKLWSFQF
jgi:hypothetical protein